MDEKRLSAMSVAILSLGKNMDKAIDPGVTDHIYVESEEGFSIVTGCGDDAVFFVLASKEAQQGALMSEINRTLADIKPALKS